LRENVLDKAVSYTIIIMYHKDITVIMQQVILVFINKDYE